MCQRSARDDAIKSYKCVCASKHVPIKGTLVRIEWNRDISAECIKKQHDSVGLWCLLVVSLCTLTGCVLVCLCRSVDI